MGQVRLHRMVQCGCAALVFVALAACSTPVPGTGAPADPVPRATPPAAPAFPLPYDADDATLLGIILESHRIAGVASLLKPLVPDHPVPCTPYGAYGIADFVERDYFAPGSVLQTLLDNGFVAAWASCQADNAGSGTILLTMEMGDEQAATRAAQEILTAVRTPDDQDATLPSGAAAVITTGDGRDDVRAVHPQGRMLSFLFRLSTAGQGLATSDAVLADQRARLAAFVPTPYADLPTLQKDPAGLLDLTLDLPELETDESAATIGPYDLDGVLQFAIDPTVEREVLAANGFAGAFVRRIGADPLDYTIVTYRFPSSTQTNAAYETFAALESSSVGDEVPFTLPSIPDAPCTVTAAIDGSGTVAQQCYVGFGSVLASITIQGVPAAEDVAEMDRLLPLQRDLIDG